MSVMDAIGQFGNNLVQGISNGLSNPMLIPSLTAAYNQYQDSDRYMDYGRQAAGMASPVTTDQRQAQNQRYLDLQNNPNAHLNNSPSYQAALSQGLDAVQRKQLAGGYAGSGNMMTALSDHAGKTAAQFIDQDMQRLRKDAGYDFNPAHAASLFMQGVDSSINSRNAALDALMFPFAPQPTTINNNTGGGGQNGGGGGQNGGNGQNGQNPAGQFGPVAQGQAEKEIARLIQQGIKVPPYSPLVEQAIREGTGGETPWAQYAPQDYDTNGDGTIDYDEWTSGNNQGVMDEILGGEGSPLLGGDLNEGLPFPIYDDEGQLMPEAIEGLEDIFGSYGGGGEDINWEELFGGGF